MKPPILLIDISFLAHRSMYTSMGDLSFDGAATGALFGIFRDTMDFCELFSTSRIAWCFDGGYDGRLEIDPDYKVHRQEKADEEKREARRSIRQQLYRLRTKYLHEIGFKNVLYQEGFEADDIIASVCADLPKGENAIIISADGDLFQLLAEERVVIYNPASGKAINACSFQKKWGVSPTQWADAKAIAGDTSDNIMGVEGVGLKGACQFLGGTLKPTTKKFQSIVQNNALWQRNLKLTRLPFPGTKHFEIYEDELVEEKWEKVARDLGMKSLFGRSFRRVS